MEAPIYTIVIRRLPLLALLFIMIVGISIVGLNFIPPQYQTTAKILIKGNSSEISRVDSDLATAISMVSVRNQLERLRSTSLFSSALRKIGLNSDPNSETFQSLYSRLQVKQMPSSTVLQIQMKGKSRETITQVTNTLIECLIEENQTIRKDDVQQIVDYLTGKIQEIQSELESAKYTNKNVATVPKASNKALYDTSRGLALNQIDYQTLQKGLPVTDWNRVSYLFSENSSFIKSYRQAISKPVVSLSVLMSDSKTNSNGIKKIQADIWREKVKTANQILKTIAQFQLKGPNWERLTYTTLRIIELKELQTNLKGKVVTTPGIVVNDKSVESLIEMEAVLIEKLTNLKMSEGLTDSEIEWVDRAITPDRPYFPTLPLNIVIGILAGLGVCILVIYCGLIVERSKGNINLSNS